MNEYRVAYRFEYGGRIYTGSLPTYGANEDRARDAIKAELNETYGSVKIIEMHVYDA